MADAVLAVVPSAQKLTSTDISFNSKQIRFPVENEGWKQLSAMGTIKRDIKDSVTTEVAWFAIGEAQFVTHPGETAPYFGLETKKLMGSGPRFIVGLGNDALGYILKPSFFEVDSIPHAAYLTSMSVGRPTGPMLMEQLSSIIPISK